MRQKVIMLQRMTMVNFLIVLFRKSIYNVTNVFMVYWWGTDSYFNNEPIQIGGIETMTAVYGSLGPNLLDVKHKQAE